MRESQQAGMRLLLLMAVISIQVAVILLQYLTAEVHPKLIEQGRRTLVSIRPGMTGRDLVCLVGVPTFKEPRRDRTVRWVYRPWPSMAAYVDVDASGKVISVRFVPT